MTGDWARQDIFTGIFDKVIILFLSKEDPHIQAPFVYLCQAELRVEISPPQQLTSASCFLFSGPPLRPSCPSLFGQRQSPTLDCCCDVVALRRCFKVQIKPNLVRPRSPKTGERGMSESGQVSGNKSDNQEDGKLLWGQLSQLEIIQVVCDTHANLQHTVSLKILLSRAAHAFFIEFKWNSLGVCRHLFTSHKAHCTAFIWIGSSKANQIKFLLNFESWFSHKALYNSVFMLEIDLARSIIRFWLTESVFWRIFIQFQIK